ncbi:MAG: LysR substrate-binding domain-containing protein [Acidimicrobiales bacterium]
MDLRQLEYVVAVAEAGGFTAGAAAAHVAQPSLSARVRDLERELGVELFHRVGRGSHPSSAGQIVIDHARVVLRDLGALRAAAAAVVGLEGGALDVVALPTLAVDPLARLVGAFRAAHPRVVVRIEEADDARGGGGVADLVRAGRAEIGVAELPTPAGDLVELPMADQQLLAIGVDSMSIRRLADVARSPLVLTPPGTSSRRVVEAAFAALGIEPIVAVEVAQREAIVPLVLAGAGVGFVPRAQADAAVAQGAVAVRTVPPLVRRIGLLHRPGLLSPAAQAFVALENVT